jgi:hypothetical protein
VTGGIIVDLSARRLGEERLSHASLLPEQVQDPTSTLLLDSRRPLPTLDFLLPLPSTIAIEATAMLLPEASHPPAVACLRV